MPSMLPPEKDPGRFNPALRNREIVLDPARIGALIKEHFPEGEAQRFLANTVDMLREHVRVLGATLDAGNLGAAGGAVVALAALASRAGARQVERDGRLIQASLNAGRLERARRLWHRLHYNLAALDQALGQLFP
ncbi:MULTISPECIES: hypothetical protein [Arthrobacter]|nr:MULTISPECIES: hypothetical protein [Arthrobacter]